MAECVSVSTSHAWAAICIQVPTRRDRLSAEVEAVVGNLERREGGARDAPYQRAHARSLMELLGELLERRQRRSSISVDGPRSRVRDERVAQRLRPLRADLLGELAPRGGGIEPGRAAVEARPPSRDTRPSCARFATVRDSSVGFRPSCSATSESRIGPLRTVLSSTATRVGVRSAARPRLGRAQHAGQAPEHDPQPLCVSVSTPAVICLPSILACRQAS